MWVPHHRGMVYPQVVDQRGTPQLWKIPENMLNNQLWIADNGWASSLGVSQRATTLHIKKIIKCCKGS